MDPTTNSSTTKEYTDEELRKHLDAVRQVCKGMTAITYANEKEPGIQYFLRLRDAISILQSSGFDSELLFKALQVDPIRDRQPKSDDVRTWCQVGQQLLKLGKLSNDESWANLTGRLIYETRPFKRFEMRSIKSILEGKRGRFLTYIEKAQQWSNLDDFAKSVDEDPLSALDSPSDSMRQNREPGSDLELGTHSVVSTQQTDQTLNVLDPAYGSVPSGAYNGIRNDDRSQDTLPATEQTVDVDM